MAEPGANQDQAGGSQDQLSFAPPGWRSVTPRIVAQDAPGLVRFLEQVFGATGECRTDGPSVITLGDSMIMVSEAGPRPTTPAFLYVYVLDADDTYRRALDAGARPIEPPTDLFYGDRRAMVEDRWGNIWQIATAVAQP